jgi:hypothetical protein
MKTLKISEDTHRKLKIYCAENSLKMNEWVEVIINKEMTHARRIKSKNH